MEIENLQPLTYVIISIAFVIGTLSILIRLWCRWRLRIFGLDDAMAVFLLLVNSFQQTILYVFLYHGCGLHQSLLSESQLTTIYEWLFIEEVFYMFVHWTIKQTFLLFYLRLSPDIRFHRAVYGTMVINTLFTITNWLIAFLQCDPFDAAIHKMKYPHANCINAYVLNMVPTGLNIITDLIILILPIPTVLALQMSSKRKAATLGVICFGATAIITAFCRFEVQNQLIVITTDTSYILGRMIIVAAIEIEIAVVAVSLPAMKSLFTKITGSSNEDEEYSSGNQDIPLPAYQRSSLIRRKNGGKRLSQRGVGGGSLPGATLTESEEELMRSGSSNIKVTTDVNVSSIRGGESIGHDIEGDSEHNINSVHH